MLGRFEEFKTGRNWKRGLGLGISALLRSFLLVSKARLRERLELSRRAGERFCWEGETGNPYQ